MPFRDLLKKKHDIEQHGPPITTAPKLPQATEFKFMRSDTNTEELIDPPQFDGDDEPDVPDSSSTQLTPKKRFSRFRSKSQSTSANDDSPPQKEHKRLSQVLARTHKRDHSASSTHIPTNLPDIADAYNEKGDQQDKEAQWEQRATILATQRPSTSSSMREVKDVSTEGSVTASRPRSVSDAESDVNIQEAIRLHEAGDLEAATRMFHTLADQENVLSQVLYGLSLRHGWGCTPDPERAVQYLSSAASNSAAIESEALKAGVKKGGAAKGELVLAIFELANCFRYGWGVSIDKPAARQYYETAAHLGDTDAMNEAAWCYVEGFGGKKDKFKAAQLLRLAEQNGSKTLGNTWIWKEKYNPPKQ